MLFIFIYIFIHLLLLFFFIICLFIYLFFNIQRHSSIIHTHPGGHFAPAGPQLSLTHQTPGDGLPSHGACGESERVPCAFFLVLGAVSW